MTRDEWLQVIRRDLTIGNDRQLGHKAERLRRQYISYLKKQTGFTENQIGHFFALEEVLSEMVEVT